MKPSVLALLVVTGMFVAPDSAFAQKDGSARPRTAPVAPNGKAGRPATTPPTAPATTAPATVSSKAPATGPAAVPTAVPAAAPAAPATVAATGRYTWCSALIAPPLQRLFSGVFLAPADTSINLTTGFAEAIKAKHHPNPQDMQCNADFPTREAAEEARARKMPADIVWRLPALPVDWVYVAP